MRNYESNKKRYDAQQIIMYDLANKGYTTHEAPKSEGDYSLFVDNGDSFIRVVVKYRATWSIPKKEIPPATLSVYKGKPVSKDTIVAVCGDNHKTICYIPFDIIGIRPSHEVTNTHWKYLIDDFKDFPCKERYVKKLLLYEGRIVDEDFKTEILDRVKKQKESLEHICSIYGLRPKMLNDWLDEKMPEYREPLIKTPITFDRESAIKRILDRTYVDVNGCWNWKLNTNKEGYGSFKIKGKEWLSHRYIYYCCNPHVDISNYVIRHLCHNPSCNNPDHLMHGTHKDNWEDSREKHMEQALNNGHKVRINGVDYRTHSEARRHTRLSSRTIRTHTHDGVFDVDKYREVCKFFKRTPRV